MDALIARAEGYRVTRDGRVQSAWKGRGRSVTLTSEWHDIKGSYDGAGYRCVALKLDGVKTTKRVHRLVAETLIPNPDNLPVVRHLNSDPTDNRVENLAWGTHWDNTQDKKGNGTYGLKPAAKLTPDDRELIHALRAAGYTQQAIAEQVGVVQTTVSRVLSGFCWGTQSRAKSAPGGDDE